MKKNCRCECNGRRVANRSLADKIFSPTVSSHEPNECLGTPIGLYKRGDKELYLCDSCVTPFDDLIAGWDTVLERRLSK